MTLLRLLLVLYRARWRRALATLVLALVAAAAGLALLGVSGWFLSGAALAGSMVAFNLFVPSSLIRTFSFLRIGARYAERIVGHSSTLRLLADLRVRTYSRLMNQSAGQLMRLREGDAISTLMADIDALDAVFLTIVVPVVIGLTGGLVLAAVWWPQSPWAALVMGVASVLVAAVLPACIARGAYRYGRASQAATRDARHAVLTAVQAHADLVALGATACAQMQFDNALARVRTARRAQTNLTALGQSALHALGGWSTLAVAIAGIEAWRIGALPAPLLVGLVLATLGFFELALPIVRNASRLGAAQAGAEHIETLLNATNDLVQISPVVPLPAAGDLALDNVTFAYHEDRPVIACFSLDLKQGEHVALVGSSGSGKSTLLKLMMRLQDPHAGTVRYGGVDLRNVAVAHWHSRVALLSQDAPVFLGTVRTNLLIARPEASDAQLWDALQRARLADYVASLSDGLDTWTGETGWSLSAGQARRLCLARVLLSSAAIWLLDEPTAGLDRENADAFLEALAENAARRTVVMATHACLPMFSVDRVIDLGEQMTAGDAPNRVAI